VLDREKTTSDVACQTKKDDLDATSEWKRRRRGSPALSCVKKRDYSQSVHLIVHKDHHCKISMCSGRRQRGASRARTDDLTDYESAALTN